jgi:hypothetical protein
VASRAREGASAAAEELRRAKRELDDLASRESDMHASGDPRAVHDAKDAAQAEFRRARARASSPADIEAAATAWLREIDRINRASRGGSAAAADARRRSSELTVRIESLTLAADAARISAESSELACQTAREALAACEEAAATAPQSVTRPVAPPPLPSAGGADRGLTPDAHDLPGNPPVMLRLLQGDRGAMSGVVRALAGDDPEARRTWQLLLTDLVDAILARAIEECILDFPAEHEFWGEFERSQCRDIARALASLGYRFDGLGSFANGRHPTQRDLSLAVGYAGLESMRIRRWPTEAGLADLYRDVAVAGDEILAARAGDMMLGEMVALLERRAERLAELWNAWGRVRPLLVAPAAR